MRQREECQFELWTECNSKCKFCYLSTANINTPNSIKLKQLDAVIKQIESPTLCEKFNKISFIGGEFFQGQLNDTKVKEKFMCLFDKVSVLLNSNKIDEVWMCATLTIGDQKDLFETVNKFKDKSKVWILTSYDTIGRFHTEKMKQDWLNNLRKVREAYPDIKINITSILTGDFIDKYMNGSLELFDIAKTFNTALFLKPTCPIDRDEKEKYTKEETNKIIPNFFPTRDQFISFLYKYRENESDFMYDKLFNMKYRSDYLFRFDDDEMHCSHRLKDSHQEVYDNSHSDSMINPCGHSTQYNIYVDSEECAVCDKEMIKEMVND